MPAPASSPSPAPQLAPAPQSTPAPTPTAHLDRVQISPEAVTLTPGGVQQLSAKALDQYGNELAGVQFSYTAEQGGKIDEQGRFKADTKAGDYPKAIKVVARQGEIVQSAFVSLKIVPGPLDRLVLSPETVTLAPGGVQQFTAKTLDQYGNDIKDFTSRWAVAEGGGRVYANGIFVAGTKAGSYRDTVKVEATYGGASEAAAASVTVSALPSGQTLIFTPTMPAPVPGLGYLIYEDDFSSNLGWSEVSQDGREYYLKDGVYHMTVPSGGRAVWAPGRSLSQLGDFSLVVTLSQISGPQDSKNGITFKIGDTGQKGYILISPQGKIYFWKNKGPDTYMNSIEVFEGPIKTSPGESLDKVRLGVERRGAQWKVSVNGSPVISVSDTAEPLSRIGFEVSGENIHATFDNLKVYAVALPRAPPSAPSGFVVFSDTFDGWNRGWWLGERGYFQEGALHLVTASEQSSFSVNDHIHKTSSFAYQAELSFEKALPQTQGRLVLKKEQGYINFAIGPTRQFEISYWSQEDGFNYLIRKTFSGAIKGQGEVNKLLVIGRDSSLEFYVNDVFLGSSADPYPDSPVTKIRLSVKGEGSQVAFDNVALHSLLPLPAATLEPSAKLPQVKLDMAATKRVFAVFAFLNAAGHDEGEGSYGFTPMRVRVREALAGLDPVLLRKMKDHYERRARAGFGIWQYWNLYGLRLTGEGPFQESSTTRAELKGTVSLLNEFYLRANLNRLWQEAEPEYLAHIEAVLPQFGRAGADVSAYLRQPLPSGIAFYYVPNWLVEYGGAVNNTKSSSQVYITVSPQYNAFFFTETSRHEFLHTPLDGALEKDAAAIKAKEALFQQVSQGVKHQGYDTWSRFVEDCLVRAITIRMAALYDPAWQPEKLRESVLQDYFLIEPFLEALKGFEASSGTFDQYSSRILRAIP